MPQKLHLLTYVQAVTVIWDALAAARVFRDMTIAIAYHVPCHRLLNKSVVAFISTREPMNLLIHLYLHILKP
jgi:hypothetical protein